MLIDKTGQIVKDFYALGHASVPVYLLDGESPALFDAGFTGLAHLYVQEIRNILRDRSPAFLFLTHAHWDHIGSAGVFKQAWPEMKIVASRQTRELLARPRVMKTITELNREALKALEAWGEMEVYRGTFVPFDVEVTLNPGERFPLAPERTVVAHISPGHTRDFTTYWVPERKILIASEAAGCDEIPEFIVNYDAFIEGLDTFLRMDIQVLCTGHHLVVTDEDIPNYLKSLREITETYRRTVESLLEKGKTVQEIAAVLREREWDKKPFPKQPLRAYLMNTERRILTLKERWEKRRKVS